MTTASSQLRAGADISTANVPAPRRWWQVAQGWHGPRIALAAICGLAAVLYSWGIGGSWGNAYYSAAVESMSASFENFLFGSFDAAGIITVDKPPMALWVQVVSTWVLGYSKTALLLPQALEGVAAVFLLHRTVRRWAGEHAGLLAALFMALTPITVAINRENNPDTLLVLLLVAAAYALTRAIQAPHERARSESWWLTLSAFLLGCGFLTKMLQAWIVLPVFLAAYLIGSSGGWGRTVSRISAAAATLIASSFWWVAVTALWPAPKPYIGGSSDGSAWSLIIGYNGLSRIFGGDQPGPAAGGGSSGGGSGAGLPQGVPERLAERMPGGRGGGGGFGGQPGWLRLFNEQLGGQISWLLPLCLLVLAAVLVAPLLRWRGEAPDRAKTAGWVLWGGWLLLTGLVFSFAQGTFHPYYATMLAPAVGALAGAGLVRFWGWYREPRGGSWLLLPAGIAITTGWAVALVLRVPSWNGWAAYLASAAGVLAVLLLLLGWWRGPGRVTRPAFLLGLVGVLSVPGVWSVAAAFDSAGGMGGVNPMAGPSRAGSGDPGNLPVIARGRGGPSPASADQSGSPSQTGPGRPGGMGGGSLSSQQQRVLEYVSVRVGERRIPLAVSGGAQRAASYIIHSDMTVVGMGGFTGSDNAPTVDQLTRWRRTDQLGFVLLGGPEGMRRNNADTQGRDRSQSQDGGADVSQQAGPPGGGFGRDSGRMQWVEQTCTAVDPAMLGSEQDTASGSVQLYDCRR